jgi:hypothetical protein
MRRSAPHRTRLQARLRLDRCAGVTPGGFSRARSLAESPLAIERGEADGSGATSWGNFTSAKQDWISDKKITSFFSSRPAAIAIWATVPVLRALGAEINSVYLREPLDAATGVAMHGAFDRLVVLVFRDQKLSEEGSTARSWPFRHSPHPQPSRQQSKTRPS